MRGPAKGRCSAIEKQRTTHPARAHRTLTFAHYMPLHSAATIGPSPPCAASRRTNERLVTIRVRVPVYRIYEDPNVPLTRTKEDGTIVDALCWMVDGNILVHPDRWEAFDAAFPHAVTPIPKLDHEATPSAAMKERG